MKYNNIKQGIFRSRPNRFIAYIEIEGVLEKCHVKNTGRCRELLYDGVIVYVEENDNPSRKTRFSLISVVKGERLINMDSQAPNKVVHEWLLRQEEIKNIIYIKPEYTYGNSRVDFYVEVLDNPKGVVQKILIEVKGVTLEEGGIVRFPDAPTKRGVKHIKELTKALEDGYSSMIIFVVQMKDVRWFEPNEITHKEFGQVLSKAQQKGVWIRAVECEVTENSLDITKNVPVVLENVSVIEA